MIRLTPIDINHKNFTKKLMGYDADEVHQFLHQVAMQMESLIHERNAMRDTMREKELTIHDLKERDQVLKSTITTANQMAERMKQEGEREAKLIIADAEQKAEMVIRDAKESLRKMHSEISDLKRVRLQFEANLKAMAQAHLSLLEQSDKYLPQASLPQMSFDNNNKATSKEAG